MSENSNTIEKVSDMIGWVGSAPTLYPDNTAVERRYGSNTKS
ncbi:hypothetical protein JCM19232_3853 [Vibrio ishigakensis]|uniref:Uncharacterized protein n=1 Tax=Vibrio ishigakensis TaxID=1481914 RepID=A0A0B8P3Y3_9VIBR|nr:hypothetical protein JCM19232_3853 [Vibrio ishigakensis]